MKKIALLVLLLTSTILWGQNPLLIPDTISGTNVNLTLQTGTHQFFTGINTNTMGANGNILGPTLLLNAGDTVSFSVNNQLGEPTTIHWHGVHVAPENDGGPHTVIQPGSTWTPTFEIMDKAGTYWYHPHLHEKTGKHVSKGIAGIFIVRDAEEAALNLPRTYGVDDFPLVIQTKGFDASNEIEVHTNSDDVSMVNATLDPALATPAQIVRFRVLNGSSQRVFNLGLNNNQSFTQIASDGGLLSAPLSLTRLKLAPGERAEILIDFSAQQGQTVYLKSYASEFPNGVYGATNPGMGAPLVLNNYTPNTMNGTDFNIMQFNVGAPTASPVTTIPSTLATVTPIPEASANTSRTLTMTAAAMGPTIVLNGHFLINGVSFDMSVINYTIPLNNTEIWSIVNQSPISHPFHIHDVQFYVLDRNGVAPPPQEQGRKDVILVAPQETVRFICKFEHFSNDTIPYMYHCHMIPHEDSGMMGQFVVVDLSTDVIELENNEKNKAVLYPNPIISTLNLDQIDALEISSYQVIAIDGKVVLGGALKSNSINFSELNTGLYFVRLLSKKDGKMYTFKVQKE